jgi:VWFA-related protein
MHQQRGPAIVAFALAGLAAFAGVDATAPPPAAPPAGAAVIGVRAVAREGQAFGGLQPGDVRVLVDGQPATVLAVHPQAPTPMPGVTALPPRRVVVVVNRSSIAAGAGRAVLEQVAAFLERLPASEYGAVWPIPAARPQLVLTGDRTITRAALLAATGTRTASTLRFTLPALDAARIAGGDQMLLDVVAERECPQAGGNRDDLARCREELRRDASTQTEQATADVQQLARELQLLVGALGRVTGLKHIVVVTAGVGPLQEQGGAVRAIAADAAAAGVTIHALQVAQLAGTRVGMRGAELSLEGALARAAGGLALTGADAQEGLRRLEQELASEYALVFAPDPAKRDGQVHALEVTTTTSAAVTVSAPRQIRLDPVSAAPTATAAPSAPQAPAAPASPPTEAAAAAAPPPPIATPTAPAEPAGPGVPTASPVDPGLASMPLQTLLSRVADYGRRYEQTMATVVIEERYVQLLKRWAFPPKAADAKRLAWLPGAGSPDRIDVNVYERRQTRADLLLVQLPSQRWTAFRDILEVNGREQRGREDRLRKLFLQQTDDSHRQLHRINEASADLNLGRFYREINLPTVGLMILQAAYQSRFAFRAGGVDRVGDTVCRQIVFNETGRPTLVRTLAEVDVPLTGSACVDANGVLWRTRLELDGRVTARGAIEVTYGPHERVDVLVPVSMWEWYLPAEQNDVRGPAYVEAMATYSNLRQFSVMTSEIVK